MEREQMVLEPNQFFDLPFDVQRRIMIEDLSLKSIKNLCATSLLNKRYESLFQDLCNNAEIWRSKLKYVFPTYYSRIERIANETERDYYDFEFWRNAYIRLYTALNGYDELFLDAIEQGNINQIAELIDIGVDPITLRDREGKTVLFYVTDGNLTEQLLNTGVDPTVRDNKGNTALIEASRKGLENVVSVLLDDNRIDINANNNYGYTAIVEAGLIDNMNIVNMLKRAGADDSPLETISFSLKRAFRSEPPPAGFVYYGEY